MTPWTSSAWRRRAAAVAVLVLGPCCGPPSLAHSDATIPPHPETPAAPFDYCDGAPPDAACYAARRDPDSDRITLARAIADRTIDVHPVTALDWDWEEAVLMLGIAELHRVTGEPRYLHYYRGWLDHHIAAGVHINTSDSCAPALLAALLALDGRPSPHRGVVDDALHYLDHRALRTQSGGLNHLGSYGQLGASLWADSLFMFGGLLTRWGEAREPARLTMMGEQFTIFADALQGPDGLFAHASGWAGIDDPSVRWARGNGWVSAAGHDYLRARRVRDEEDPTVATVLASQRAALLGAQDPASGLWWTVLDRPGETYLETSASALITYALARGWRYGHVDDDALPAIHRAISGLHTRIVDDPEGRPVVTGVSGPTLPGTFHGYATVPLVDDRPYGVGAVLLALIESSGLPSGEV